MKTTGWVRLRRGGIVLLAVTALLLLGSAQVFADAIVYTEQSTGSGTIGASTFNNASVKITLSGNTANIINLGSGLFENFGTAVVTIGGVGTATFTDSILVFDNQGASAAGIFDNTMGINILDTASPIFATYDLGSNIGPVVGGTLFNPGFGFNTSLGTLTLTSMDANSTFTATVPEPATLCLVGAGAAMLWRRRKK